MKYQQISADNPVFHVKRAPINVGGILFKAAAKHRIACCDCGLAHDLVMVVHQKHISVWASRNERATAQKRRRGKHLCQPVK